MRNVMKTIYMSGILVCLWCVSCSEMNELSDRFLNEGEITYAAMPDSVWIGAGKERVQFELYINTNRVKTARIYWNNYADSTDLDIGNKAGVFYKIVENLPEQSYLFNVVNMDQYGNRSLPYEVSGRSLGQKYENAMINRRLVSISRNKDGNKVLEWAGMDESSDARYTEVLYTNEQDEEIRLHIPLSEKNTVITDLKSGTMPAYRTIYIPDEVALDIFYTPYRDGELTYPGDYPLIKSEIKVVGFSNEHDSGNNAAKNAFDGNYGNRWHTQASAAYPHWMAFDMGGEAPVSRFSLWASVYDLEAGLTYDIRLPEKITLWGRNDEPSPDDLAGEDGWVKLGEYACEDRNGEQTFVIENPKPVRYLKVNAPSGMKGANIMVIGEFDIYSR